MDRRPHYLKRNDRNETIQQAIFFDTETVPHDRGDGTIHHQLAFGWATFVRRGRNGRWLTPVYQRFVTPAQFWKFVTSHTRQRVKTWVWCHNTSFDLQVVRVFSELRAAGWTMGKAIIDSPPTIIHFHCGSRTIVCADTLNIWRMSLDQLGKLTGLPKLSMPAKWTGAEIDDAYCRRDVDIIMKALCDWTDFLIHNEYGGFTPTIAGQSMRTFRHRYMQDNILIDNDKEALSIARQAYHGGRVECFVIGERHGEFYLLDVNSMYPYCMHTYSYPMRLKGVVRDVSLRDAARYLDDYCVCGHVLCTITKPYLPAVIENKLCFPVGEIDAYVSSPELRYIIEHDRVRRIESLAIYEQGMPFRNFVDDLYGKRREVRRQGDLVQAGHYKLLINSFYGKWGQNGRKYRDIGECNPDLFGAWTDIHAQTRVVTNYRAFGGRLQCWIDEPESRESHPAIAAHVTAYARMVLRALIEKAGRENCLYCDTDAVLVTRSGRDRLIDQCDEEELGALKEVGQFAHVIINGCKDYVLDGKRTLKGIRVTAKQIDVNTYQQVKWHSLIGSLRKGVLDGPITSSVTKTLRRRYGKGTIDGCGFVLPFHLG